MQSKIQHIYIYFSLWIGLYIQTVLPIYPNARVAQVRQNNQRVHVRSRHDLLRTKHGALHLQHMQAHLAKTLAQHCQVFRLDLFGTGHTAIQNPSNEFRGLLQSLPLLPLLQSLPLRPLLSRLNQSEPTGSAYWRSRGPRRRSRRQQLPVEDRLSIVLSHARRR